MKYQKNKMRYFIIIINHKYKLLKGGEGYNEDLYKGD